MRIAVEGCAHGDLDNIYAAMREVEANEGVPIDLLICCGDFQARGQEGEGGRSACGGRSGGHSRPFRPSPSS